MQDRSVALDVSTLDDALLSLLLSPQSIKSLFKYTKFSHLAYPYFPNSRATATGNEATGTGDDNEEDEGYHMQRLTLCIFRGIVLLFTLGSDSGATPAMTIFQSKTALVVSKNKANNGSPQRRHIYKWILLSSGLPALYHAIKLYALSNAYVHDYASLNRNSNIHTSIPTSTGTGSGRLDQNHRESLQTVAHQRRIKIISYILGMVDKVVPPAVLLQHLRCIFQRRRKNSSTSFIPSSLGMQLSGLTFVPVVTSFFHGNNISSLASSLIQRNVHFMYAYRRVLFQELMMLFEAVVPKEGFKYIMEEFKRRRRL